MHPALQNSTQWFPLGFYQSHMTLREPKVWGKSSQEWEPCEGKNLTDWKGKELEREKVVYTFFSFKFLSRPGLRRQAGLDGFLHAKKCPCFHPEFHFSSREDYVADISRAVDPDGRTDGPAGQYWSHRDPIIERGPNYYYWQVFGTMPNKFITCPSLEKCDRFFLLFTCVLMYINDIFVAVDPCCVVIIDKDWPKKIINFMNFEILNV